MKFSDLRTFNASISLIAEYKNFKNTLEEFLPIINKLEDVINSNNLPYELVNLYRTEIENKYIIVKADFNYVDLNTLGQADEIGELLTIFPDLDDESPEEFISIISKDKKILEDLLDDRIPYIESKINEVENI